MAELTAKEKSQLREWELKNNPDKAQDAVNATQEK